METPLIRDNIFKYILPELPNHPSFTNWKYCHEKQQYYTIFKGNKWYYDVINKLYIRYESNKTHGQYMNISSNGFFYYEYNIMFYYNKKAYNDVCNASYKEWAITYVPVKTLENYFKITKLDKKNHKFDKKFESLCDCCHCNERVDKYSYYDNDDNYDSSWYRFQHHDCYKKFINNVKHDNYMSESYKRSRKYNKNFNDDDTEYSNDYYNETESDNEQHYYKVIIDVPIINKFDSNIYTQYEHDITKPQRKFINDDDIEEFYDLSLYIQCKL